MRDLSWIITSNAAAAGREAGHASNDGKARLEAAIDLAAVHADRVLPEALFELSVVAYESARATAQKEG